MEKIILKAPSMEYLDTYWKEFFAYIYMLSALGAIEINIPEVTFEAETKPVANTLQKIISQEPKSRQVFVTMTQHLAQAVHFADDAIWFYTLEDESKKLDELQLDQEIVNRSYMMTCFPHRHRVITHIGNLRSVTFVIA